MSHCTVNIQGKEYRIVLNEGVCKVLDDVAMHLSSHEVRQEMCRILEQLPSFISVCQFPEIACLTDKRQLMYHANNLLSITDQDLLKLTFGEFPGAFLFQAAGILKSRESLWSWLS
ncbi:unnamed protein product [Protopolystoma xenopodis]|uniref:Uncharacterized protein n=1 Tax=Protopolystoma xenopodis TaxID=117903 RepID=A0A3S5FEM9_9PLAT|nr:unnamed protein product [Protopolystoma xenopodis]